MTEQTSILDGAFLDALETLDLNIRQIGGGGYGGTRPSRAYGSSPEFADYREYVPGDDLRRIDWKVAGRLDQYLIRRYVDERRARNRIYLDASASMGGPKGPVALRLAAALAYLSVSHMDGVSVCLLSGRRCVDLCGHIFGREAFLRAGARLDSVRFAGNADLGACIRGDPDPGADGGVSYLISDLLTESDWRGALDGLLSRGRRVALLQLLSPQELEPALGGRHTLCDSEEPGARLTLEVDRDALNAYRETVRRFLSDIRGFCASRAVPYLQMRSDERVETVLLARGCVEGLIR